MAMGWLRRSLTLRILLAVGVTVAAVIAIYTYFVIRVQNTWWYERTQAQNVLASTRIRERIDEVMLSGKREEVQRFLEELKKSQEILRGRIIKTDGEVTFSTETQDVHRVVMQPPPELFVEDRILHGTRTENGHTLAVTMAPVANHSSCYQCHDANQRFRGAVVLEKSMAPAETNIASNRNLLIVYGVVIFVLVGAVLWLLIMRFVTQPVSGLLQQMRRVQAGDLAARTATEGADEIGELSRGFNAMVASLDSTQRELRESHQKQIQQADKLASIGELASGIAHEIRNPLAGIGAAVEVLAENHGGNGQYAEVAGEIHQQIGRLNRTIRDLLEFARPREPEIEPCDVHEIIRPMLALVRPDAQKYHVRIVESFDPGLPPISADAQQLQQAILNILLNAVQAMPQGGTLTVRAELAERIGPPPRGEEKRPGSAQHAEGCRSLAGTYVRILIRDTGAGICRENLGKIFSPFYTTKHRGTGLGLSITRTIVEKHQGIIGVESEPGRGTTFTLEFAASSPLSMVGADHEQFEKPLARKEVWNHAKE
jgi:signal transduction histidine kinase